MGVRTWSSSIYFDWNFDGSFTDETAYLVSVRIERSLVAIGNPITGGSGRIQKAVIELDNKTNRFSSRLSASALYADLSNGGIYFVPVRINVNTGSDYRIFTGVCSVLSEYGKTVNRNSTVNIVAFSNEEKIRNSFASIEVAQSEAWLSSLPKEDTVIAYLLDLLGLIGTLDPGLYPVFSYLSGGSILTEIWNIAKAANGYFFCNVDGDYIYKNSTSFVGQSSVTTLTASQFSGIEIKYDDRNLSRSVRVEGVSPSVSDDSVIYTHGENIYISPGETVTLRVEYDNPAYHITTYGFSATSIGGTDLSGDLTYGATYYLGYADLSFANGSALEMVINGYSITGKEITQTPFTVHKQSTDAFWTDRSDTTLESKIKDQYLASYASADAVASLIIARQETPVPIYVISDVVYNGQIELLDKISINDSSVADSAFDIFVMALQYTISRQSGVRVSIVGVGSTELYPYQETTPGYFILGTNKLGSTDPDKARLFF